MAMAGASPCTMAAAAALHRYTACDPLAAGAAVPQPAHQGAQRGGAHPQATQGRVSLETATRSRASCGARPGRSPTTATSNCSSRAVACMPRGATRTASARSATCCPGWRCA
jgi:hypothetical protein